MLRFGTKKLLVGIAVLQDVHKILESTLALWSWVCESKLRRILKRPLDLREEGEIWMRTFSGLRSLCPSVPSSECDGPAEFAIVTS